MFKNVAGKSKKQREKLWQILKNRYWTLWSQRAFPKNKATNISATRTIKMGLSDGYVAYNNMRDSLKFEIVNGRIVHVNKKNKFICWNLDMVKDLHDECISLLDWMNKDVPASLTMSDRFDSIRKTLSP